MKSHGMRIGLVCAALLGLPGGAAFARLPSIKPPLIDAARYNPAELLPPPPPEDSPVAKSELAELVTIEKTRTPEQFAAADRDDKDENPTMFSGVMGPSFDLTKLPATARVLADVRVEEKAVAKIAKNYFRRNRPWIVDPSLKTCAREDPPRSSYPSGHATMAYSMAVVLAALDPAKAPAILARANQFSEHRLVCSMHFRSDIVAGQVLGTIVGHDLMRSPVFMAHYRAASAELRAAGLVSE